MPYDEGSLEAHFLAGEKAAVGRVGRWIAQVLTAPSFWRLRAEWQDLHQEALARTLQSLRSGRYDASRDFRVYVQGIARHTALHRLREPSFGNPDPRGREEGKDPEDDAEGSLILRQLVRRVLDMASDECRELIRAYFLEERGYADIASAMGLPLGTVKSRLFRCLEGLHQAIRKERRTPVRAARE